MHTQPQAQSVSIRGVRLFGVGHSTHALGQFVRLLGGQEVEQVADIRTVPRSRRWPQFDRDELAASLPAHGIAYVHFRALGGWRRQVEASPNGGWRNASFRGYADHALTDEFAAGLAELCRLAEDRPTAMMCSEGLWWRCHRRLVADRLVTADWEVMHIGPDGRTTRHELPDFAAVRPDGRILYPPHDRDEPSILAP